MRPAEGNTTVTELESRRPGADSHAPRSLIWVFPLASEAPVALEGARAATLTIGREDASDVRLSGDGVSRKHALLHLGHGGAAPVIEDLDSRNGVRVNGVVVRSRALATGDVVRLGGWVGVVSTAPGAFRAIAPGLYGGGVLAAALAPLERAAKSDLPVVLEGETGTGKEVVANAAHAWSGRPGALIAVNCAALPEGLAEAELFGYRRGAFTGAERASSGFFRAADGGTLLLDEVSDLPLPIQAKLLRVLEQREVQPLGELKPVPIDVRLIVAGQQSLAKAVQEGRFRADLLARVEGLTVRLPPLRQRREDVLPLFSQLLSATAGGHVPAVEAEFVEQLTAHDWPFNVRELVLLVRRLLVLHAGEPSLRARHLPERMSAEPASASSPRAEAPSRARETPSAEPVELPALVAALRASGGNVARASALLGITRQRAYRLMEGYAVDLEALRQPEGGGT